MCVSLSGIHSLSLSHEKLNPKKIEKWFFFAYTLQQQQHAVIGGR